MKVNYIIPCVCIDHLPDTSDDACDYGMPDIAVGQGEWFSCYCRNCGRGGRWLNHTSVYKALKDWNECQLTCWTTKVYHGFSNIPMKDAEPWRIEMIKRIKEKINE